MMISDIKALIQPMLEESTITGVEDFGDVFAIHFTNNKYYESKRFEDMAVGAGPIIFIKESKAIFHTGSGRTASEYVAAYRNCGDVFGLLGQNIKIYELPKGVDKKLCILRLKKILGYNLRDAKNIVEKMDLKEAIKIKLKDEWHARNVLGKLLDAGFLAKHIWDKSN